MTFSVPHWFPTLSRTPPAVTGLRYNQGSDSTRSGGRQTLLYFAYNARISPDQMKLTAPKAEFQFIAHLPEWGLDFPIASEHWGGALPAVQPEPGSTVWGAVYEVPKNELAAIDEIEANEQRSAETVEAMDRSGKRHKVTVHLLNGASTTNGNGNSRPSAEYLQLMVSGSKHWSLPFGWIAGLEEHLENGA